MTSNAADEAAAELEKIAFGLSLAELKSTNYSFPTFGPFTPFTPYNDSEISNGTVADGHAVHVEPATETEPSTANKVNLAPVLSLSAFALLIAVSVVWKYAAKCRRRNTRKREVGLDEDLLRYGMETRASRYRGVWIAGSSSDEERRSVLPESSARHDSSSGYKSSLRETDMKAYLTVDRTPSLMSDLQRTGSSEYLAFVCASSSESCAGGE